MGIIGFLQLTTLLDFRNDLPRGFAKIGGIYNAVKSNDLLVLPVRIELTTSPLPRECSTTELRQRPGESRFTCEKSRRFLPYGGCQRKRRRLPGTGQRDLRCPHAQRRQSGEMGGAERAAVCRLARKPQA